MPGRQGTVDISSVANRASYICLTVRGGFAFEVDDVADYQRDTTEEMVAPIKLQSKRQTPSASITLRHFRPVWASLA